MAVYPLLQHTKDDFPTLHTRSKRSTSFSADVVAGRLPIFVYSPYAAFFMNPDVSRMSKPNGVSTFSYFRRGYRSTLDVFV